MRYYNQQVNNLNMLNIPLIDFLAEKGQENNNNDYLIIKCEEQKEDNEDNSINDLKWNDKEENNINNINIINNKNNNNIYISNIK